MNLREMDLRTAFCGGLTKVKLKVIGTPDEDGCVELSCVETVTDGRQQTLVLSDEKGE